MVRKPVAALLMLLLLSVPSGAVDETAKPGERLTVMRLRYRSAKGASARKAAGTPLIVALVALADAKVAGEQSAEAVKLYREAIPIATILRGSKTDIAAKLKFAQARVVVEKKLTVLRAAMAARTASCWWRSTRTNESSGRATRRTGTPTSPLTKRTGTCPP